MLNQCIKNHLPNFIAGDDAVFECQLGSEAHVTWLKDNKALDDRLADRVTKSVSEDHSYKLEISHLMERDSGIYTALAKTAEGSSTCTAQLLVRESEYIFPTSIWDSILAGKQSGNPLSLPSWISLSPCVK